MTRTAMYTVDYKTNTVTFSTAAYDVACTNYESDEAKLLRMFKADGFTVVRKTRKAPTKRANPNKVKMLTYQQMRDFLNLLEDHDEMIAEFDSLVAAHKHDGDRMTVINKWFRNECPQYGNSTMYEFTEDGHLVHNPNPSPVKRIA